MIRKFFGFGAFCLLASLANAQTVAVNWNDVHQQIDGFGASTAWRSSMTTAQADMFFSVTNGVGLSFLRNHINTNGTTGELSMMQQAVARGARVWSAPWSPPAAWKDNNNVNSGGHLLASHYQDYANQLATYVANMKASGVDIYALSIQNEPDYVASYESCIWSSQEMHDFLPFLYNALAAKGVSTTKILAGEQSPWSLEVTSAITADASTLNQVGILAAHNYSGTIQPFNTKGKQLWETEVSTFGSFDGSMGDALSWANNIHQFLTNAQVNAWHYWWLISGSADNEGLTDNSGNPAKRLYVLGNFSKFVRPGFYRVGTTGGGNLQVSAYKDPASGAFAVVAINGSSSNVSQTFSFSGFSASTVTPWVTSSSLSLVQQSAVTVSGSSSFTYNLPASSVVTFVGQAGASSTDTQAPSTPTNVTASALSASQISLTWTASTDNSAVAGYKILRNGTQVGTSTTNSYTDTGLTASTAYVYTVSAYDGAGNSSANSVTASATTKASNGTCPTTISTNAFTGCYYTDMNLTTFGMSRVDTAINFDWVRNSPDPSIPADGFSVRWQGNFTFAAGTYTFSSSEDDGMRVYVDGTQVINDWADHALTSKTGTATLTAGTHLVKVEYYDNTLEAVAKLSWAQSGGSGGTTNTAPTITSFTSSLTSLLLGDSATLSWVVTGTPTPTVSINGSAVTGNSLVVLPLLTTSYTLTATNSVGTATAQVGLTVGSTTPVPPVTTANGAPSLFFTDLESGSNTGGDNNNGVYVTIYGSNFGTSPTVTVGGGQALIKLQPSSWLWYQKMTIQLGPNAKTGSIQVSNSSGASNPLPFAVTGAKIYFVSTSGNDSNAGTSTSAAWATMSKCRHTIAAGDVCYIMNGVTQTDDNYHAALVLGTTGSASAFRAIIAYPGATATIGSTAGERGVMTCSNLSDCSGADGGSYWIVAGFSLRGTEAVYINQTHDIKIVGNNVQCPNGDGSTACFGAGEGQNYRFYGNEVSNAGVTNASKTYHSMYFSTNANFIEVGWGSVHDSNGCRGIQFHSTAGNNQYGLSVHDTLIHDIRCDGINFATIDPSKGKVEAYNNVIYNTGRGPDPPDGSSDYACIYVPAFTNAGTLGSGTVDVYNNTMYNCGTWDSNYGGAVNTDNGTTVGVRLRNNIIQQSNSRPYIGKGTNLSVISGSNNLYFGNGAAPSQTTGNLNVSPLLTSIGSDFHLQSGSPAKDAGVNTGQAMDRDGTRRPQGSAYDIGAYEFSQGGGTTPPPASACDINGDGVTNQADVTALINLTIGPSASSCGTADLNANGKCDVVDVQRVINVTLGQSCRTGQ